MIEFAAGDRLTTDHFHTLPKRIVLTEEVKTRMARCRAWLDQIVSDGHRVIYGVNTGFGSLCNTIIPPDQLEELQYNLLKSHACGAGNEIPQEIVKIMLLLKVQNLSYGHSGTQVETAERLIYMYEHDILPVVYEHGSLGASGDLAPLAHLVLPLIGEGEVYDGGERKPASRMLQDHQLEPLKLKAKEGLALINGTQYMTGMGMYILSQAHRMWQLSHGVASISLQAFDGRPDAFDEAVQRIRPHEGQIASAAHMRQWLQGGSITQTPRTYVQDPYSFRCIPQVHGAVYDALKYITGIMETEINAVTDNPLIFPEEDKVISGGNFHGETLALALDQLALAMHELGNISERRTYLLISGQRGLPAFLTPNPGLHSGFMIPQYTAASLVSINKQYCTPASADSIVSSNGQEDHVSMGANAAVKALKVMEHTWQILGIELMAAAQAAGLNQNIQLSSSSAELMHLYRKVVPAITEDIYMQPYLAASAQFLKNYH